VHDLGDKRFFMLRNHGLLTVGQSIAEAFVAMYFFEATCMIQIRAQAGGELIHVSPHIVENAQVQWQQVTRGVGGTLAWPALLRKLDRFDPSYRS
jgi:ribulose-5-phosphate 4-epimerase/fuculose-1-phosphate aldolase